MRHASLSLVLLALAAVPEARAQDPQGGWPCRITSVELIYGTPHTTPGDEQLVELWAVGPSGNTLRGAWLTTDPGTAVGGCAWAMNAEGPTGVTDAYIEPGDVGVVRIYDASGCPPLDGAVRPGREYTYFHCGISPSSTPGYGFFCPPTSGYHSQDLLIVEYHYVSCGSLPQYANGTSHHAHLPQYPCSLLETLQPYGLSRTTALPYHVGAAPDDDIHIFLTKQAAYRHADGTQRFRLQSAGFTLLSGYTYTWDLPDGVVELTRSPQFVVNGTLEVDGMTLTSYLDPPHAGAPPAPWAGLRVTAGSTLRATGPLTIAGTTDPTLDPAPIDVEGTLAVAAGGTLTLTGDLDLTLYHDLVVEAGGVLSISPGATLRFKPGRRLVVEGRLAATGATFREADAGQGWGGLVIRKPAGGGLAALPPNTLHGTTVRDVAMPPGERALRGAVHVVDREVLVTGAPPLDVSEVFGGTGGVIGVFATGPEADVTITSGSLIYENDGGGVLASGGAAVTISHGSEVFDNPGGGVAAHWYGSTLTLDGVTVRDHDGPGSAAAPGVRALNHGQVLFANGASATRVQVLNNEGGLDAQSGGSLDAGRCQPGDPAPCPGRNVHEITNNAPGGAFFDARSEGGSTLYAQGNDWDVTAASDLELDYDATSCLSVCPLVGGVCDVTEPCQASEGQRGMEGVLALVDEAERARLAGDTAAFGLAADAVVAALASEEEGDRRAAFEGATRLFAWAQPAGPLTALVDLAGQPGDGRPWALRALGVARASGEDYALARTAADTLAVAYAGTEHARFGLGLTVRAAVAQGDEAGAVAALLALAAQFPEADEVGALAALVLGAFPGADLTGLEGGALAPSATASASVPAASSVLLRVEAARPNPASGGTTVPFALAEAADVEAALYDGLGRRVAVLARGNYEAGAHALSLDGSSLPAGVYVVYVRAHAASGPSGTSTAVRRITLAR